MVEDIANTFENWCRKLEARGYSLTQASLPNKAIEIAEKSKPDLVLMDILFDNYENSKVLHEDRCNGIVAGEQIYLRFNIPVVFFTVAPDAIKRHPKALEIANLFGFLSKKSLNVDVEGVDSKIKSALQTFRTINDKSGIFGIDRHFKCTFINERVYQLYPTLSKGSATLPLETDTIARLSDIMKSTRFGAPPTSCMIRLESDPVCLDSKVESVFYRAELVGLRVELV